MLRVRLRYKIAIVLATLGAFWGYRWCGGKSAPPSLSAPGGLSGSSKNQSKRLPVPNSLPRKIQMPRVDEGELILDSEFILDSEWCWGECGSPCVIAKAGERECPKECEIDDECGAEELCMTSRTDAQGRRIRRCLSDQCSGVDFHDECGPDMSCRYIGRLEGSIYMCVPAGTRKTGEPCGGGEYDKIGLCEQGLECFNGECSPASCVADEDCGETARCFQFAGGMHQCVPFCETDDDCPDAKVCNLESEVGHCVAPETMGCSLSGCRGNSECVVQFIQPYLTVSACLQKCSSTAECGEGRACGNTQDILTPYCYDKCNDDLPCKDGWICADEAVSLDDSSTPKMCVRDVEGEVYSFFNQYESR